MDTTSRMLGAFSPKPKEGGLRAKHCPIAKRYLEIQAQEEQRARLEESGWDWEVTDTRPAKGSPAIDTKDFAPSNAHHQTGFSKLMTGQSSFSQSDEVSAAKQRKGKGVAKSRLRISAPRFPDLADSKAEGHSQGGNDLGARHREASHHRRSSASRSNDISKRNGYYHQHQKSSSSSSSAQTFVAQLNQSRFSESSSGSHGAAPRRPSRTGTDNLLTTYEGLGMAITRSRDQESTPSTSTAPNRGPQGQHSTHRPLKPTPPPVRGFGDTIPQRAHKPASHSAGHHAHSRSLSSKASPSVGQTSSSFSPSFTLSPSTVSQLDFNSSFIISPLSPENNEHNNLVSGGFAALTGNAGTKDPLVQRTDTGTLDTKIGCESDTTSHAINRQRKAVYDLHQHLNALGLPQAAGSRDSALTFQSSAATIVADEDNTLTTTHDKESSQPASPTFPLQGVASPSSSQHQHRRKRSSLVRPIIASRSAARPLSGARRSNNNKRHSRGASSLSKQGKPTAWLETEEEEMLPVTQDQRKQHISRKAISNSSPKVGHGSRAMKSPGLQSERNLKSAWSTRGERTATKWSVPDSVHDIFTGQRFNRPSEVNEIVSSNRLEQMRKAKMAQAAAAKQAAADEEARHSSGSEGSTPSLGTGSDTSDSSLWSVLSHHPDYQRRGSPATPPLGTSPTTMAKKQVIKRKALPPLPTATDSRRNTTTTEKSSANGDIPIMFEGSFHEGNVSPLRIIKRNTISPPLPGVPIPSFALDPSTLPSTPPLPPKSGLRGGKVTTVSPSGSHSRNASDSTASTSMSAEQAEHVTEGSSTDASDSASLTSSSSSIYSSAPFSPGPATPVSPSKAQEIKDMFLNNQDEENFYLRSTPYTLMHPGFAHGPIRLHKRSLSSTAAAAKMAPSTSRNSSPATTKSRNGHKKGQSSKAIGASMDWTAFQTAILGGAPEVGDVTGEIEDSKTADELSGWYSGFGFSNEGRLVEESEGKPAKKSEKVEPVKRAPPATDRQSETGAGDVAISPTTKSSSSQPPRLSIAIESFDLTDPTATAGSVDSNLPYRTSPDEVLPALAPAPLSVRRKRPVLPKLDTKCLPESHRTSKKGLQGDGGFEPFGVASAPTTNHQAKGVKPALHPPRVLAASKSDSVVPTLSSQQQQSKGLLTRVKGFQQPRPVQKATSPPPNKIQVPAAHSIRDTDTFDAPRAAFAVPTRSATPEPLRTKKMQDPISNRSSSAMGRQQQAPANLNFSQEIAARQQAMTARSQSAKVEQEPFKAPSPVKGFQLQTSQLQLPPPRKPKERKSEEGMSTAAAAAPAVASGNGIRNGRVKNYTLAPSDYSLTNINRGLSAKRSQNFQIGGSPTGDADPSAIDEGITFSKPVPDRTIAHLPSDDNITFKTPAKTTPRKNSSARAAEAQVPFKATPPSVTGGATQQPFIVGQDTDKFVVESDDLSAKRSELELDQPMGFNLSSDLGDFLRYEAEYAYATDL